MGRQGEVLKSLLKQMTNRKSEDRSTQQLQLSNSLPRGALTLDEIERGGGRAESQVTGFGEPLPALMTKAMTLEEIERQMTSGLNSIHTKTVNIQMFPLLHCLNSSI